LRSNGLPGAIVRFFDKGKGRRSDRADDKVVTSSITDCYGLVLYSICWDILIVYLYRGDLDGRDGVFE
jgi:hypothetical protein